MYLASLVLAFILSFIFMRFSEIIGLEDIKKTLVHSVQNSHVAHAQLFIGKTGSGALPMALAYASYVNCQNKSPTDSCGECTSCRKFDKFIHPDLHFVFPTATTKSIKKREDAISTAFMEEWRKFLAQNPYRNLREWAQALGAENKQCIIPVHEGRNIIKTLSLKAYEAEYKVLMIWLPELMNVNAANALLKILEEPPAKTLFLLVAESRDKMLKTILSRTQPIMIRPFTDAEIKQNLIQKFQTKEVRASQISALSDGNLSEAFRLNQETKDDSQERFAEWMRLCFRSDYSEMVNQSHKFQEYDKEAQKALLQYGLSMLREALAFKFGGEKLVRLEAEALVFIKKFSTVIHDKNIELLTHYFTEAYMNIERNANPKILFLDVSLLVSKALKIRQI